MKRITQLNPYAIIIIYSGVFIFLISIVIGLLTSGRFQEVFWDFPSPNPQFWQAAVSFLIAWLFTPVCAILFYYWRVKKGALPKPKQSFRQLSANVAASMTLGLVWVSLLPMPFRVSCLEEFTRKRMFTEYWHSFGAYHIFIDAIHNTHQSIQGSIGYICLDHTYSSGWMLFFAFALSLGLGIATLAVFRKILEKIKK